MLPTAPPQEDEVVQRVLNRVLTFEESLGVPLHKKWNELYRQYRSFRKWHDEWVRSPNDRDAWVPEARKKWGADLHIPISFRTIETVVPRAIANAPKLLYLPRTEQSREGVRMVQLLVDSQQEQIAIDLPFQAVMRSGHIYGLGAGKTFWDKKTRQRRRMQMVPVQETGQPTHVLGEPEDDLYFDDPRFADLDIFDLMWDPYGYEVENCGWMGQQIWLSIEACLERLQNGSWNSVSAQGLDAQTLQSLSGSNAVYEKNWRARMEESGFNPASFNKRGEHIHEIIEYHDGQNVYSILDRQVLVASGESPCAQMPFQIYRPTPLQHQFAGVGSLEPLEHLQRELDTLRSQRRDAVTLSLKAPIAYDDTAVEASDIVFNPTGLIPVDGDPRAAIMQLGPKSIDGTGFQEEASIRTDIAETAGLADAADNTPGGTTNTATEAQLVQASVGRRIELGARRFELEVVRPAACLFLYLDQREIRQQRTLPIMANSDTSADPDVGRYKWFQIGPGELEGEYDIIVEGGSMAARNIPQDRADASQLFNMLAGDWFTNPTKVRERVYELMGAKFPHDWLRSPEPSIPESTLRFLMEAGVDPAIIQQAYLRAREVTAPEEGGAGGPDVPLSGQQPSAAR